MLLSFSIKSSAAVPAATSKQITEVYEHPAAVHILRKN